MSQVRKGLCPLFGRCYLEIGGAHMPRVRFEFEYTLGETEKVDCI